MVSTENNMSSSNSTSNNVPNSNHQRLSVSSNEENFDPDVVRRAVESLVLEKFGSKFSSTYARSVVRKFRNSERTSSNSDYTVESKGEERPAETFKDVAVARKLRKSDGTSSSSDYTVESEEEEQRSVKAFEDMATQTTYEVSEPSKSVLSNPVSNTRSRLINCLWTDWSSIRVGDSVDTSRISKEEYLETDVPSIPVEKSVKIEEESSKSVLSNPVSNTRKRQVKFLQTDWSAIRVGDSVDTSRISKDEYLETDVSSIPVENSVKIEEEPSKSVLSNPVSNTRRRRIRFLGTHWSSIRLGDSVDTSRISKDEYLETDVSSIPVENSVKIEEEPSKSVLSNPVSNTRRRRRRFLGTHWSSIRIGDSFDTSRISKEEYFKTDESSIPVESSESNVSYVSIDKSVKIEEDPLSTNGVPEVSTQTFVEQIYVLNTTKSQILKAITNDEKQKRDMLSRGRLEAERLLLITDMKIMALLLEDKHLPYEESDLGIFCSGNLELSDVRLFLNDVRIYDEFVFCTISFGGEVYASEMSRIKTNGLVRVNRSFAFKQLPLNFKLELRVYSISSQVFKKPARSCILCNNQQRNYIDLIPVGESLFRLCGQTEIRPRHFTNFDKIEIPFNTGILTASISTEANVKSNLTEFVNIRQNSAPLQLWNGQWTVLNGRVLDCFDFPPSELMKREPTLRVPLTAACILSTASPKDATRPLTLMLKCNNNQEIFMSFNSHDTFQLWERYLQFIISHIRAWERC